MRRLLARSGLFALVFALIGAAAGAQPVAPSLADLRGLAMTESKVTVTDASGREYRGTIADASVSGLVLRIGDDTRSFDAPDVRSVRARRDDPLANGALIGAAVTGGLSSLIFLDNECNDDPACYAAVGVYAGVGALLGVAVDAMIHRTVAVYSAPSAAQRFFTVAPIASVGRAGARVTFGF